ncbi:MAG TPA: response regulator [Thermoanaerobaculia bacterium]|nr:response regulator [Thermoanaerobaculia bacterium]
MPKKILLADDSITIQKVVELTFSDGDYEVIATNNGAKAIQKIGEIRPDIILSDIIMPEKNGYEVCEFVKSHPELRHIPVILLTGTFEPFDPDRAEKAGCDAVVTKPFESQSLIHKVEELIADAAGTAVFAAPAENPTDVSPSNASQSDLASFEEAEETRTWPAPSLGESGGEQPRQPTEEAPFSPPPSYATEQIAERKPEPSAFSSAQRHQPAHDPSLAITAPPFPKPDIAVDHDEEIFAASPEPEAAPSDLPFEPEPAAEPANFDETRAYSMNEIGWSKPPAADLAAKPETESPFAPSEEEAEPGLLSEPRPEAHEEQHPLGEITSEPQEEESIFEQPEESARMMEMWSPGPGLGEGAEEPLGGAAASSFEEPSPQSEPLFESPPAEEPFVEPEPPAAWSPSAAEPAQDTAPWQEEEAGQEPVAEEPAAAAGPWGAIPEEAPPPAAGETETAARVSASGLSEDQIERIARRVVELLSDRIVRDIAWEVIPDLAENVVRDRIRQLENEV